MATVSINSEQITSIGNSLKSKGEQILTQYKDTCASALQMSTQCLQMSGLDTEQFFKALENIYTKLNERLSALADFLINTVAADYDALSQAITNSFNNDFANEIAGILGIAGAVSGGAVGGSGSTGGSGGSGGSGGTKGKNPTTTAPTTVKKTEPAVIMKCDGFYKAVKNCSGETVYTKISDSETVIRNCSGQQVVIQKTQSAEYQMEQAAKAKSTQPTTVASTQPKDYIIAGCKKICVATTTPKTKTTSTYKAGGAQSSYAANGGNSSGSSGSSYAANPNAGKTTTTKVISRC